MNEIKILLLIVTLLLSSCRSDMEENTTNFEIQLPNHIKQLENLKVIYPSTQQPDTVILSQESNFESGDEVRMSGYISGFSVDDGGRVFIVSSVPGNLGVYVFNPDGSYLTTIGRFGQGPGEFEAIGAIDILDNELILFDPRLQKFAIYSLDNFDKIEEEIIKLSEVTKVDQIPAIAKGIDLKLLNNELMVLKVGMSSLIEENDGDRNYYYAVQRDGYVNSGKLLEVDRHTRYFLPEREGFALPITKPFNRSSLVSISRLGSFFSAWTEDFLIKEFDPNGQYIQSFFYPVEEIDFSLDQISVAEHEHRMFRNQEIPETWPALHTMELDDEERLWVATIIENDSAYQWFVFNMNGEMLARFIKSGDRSSRAVVVKPLIAIKDGYYYFHERDIRQGIDRIVKYKIQFIEK